MNEPPTVGQIIVIFVIVPAVLAVIIATANNLVQKVAKRTAVILLPRDFTPLELENIRNVLSELGLGGAIITCGDYRREIPKEPLP